MLCGSLWRVPATPLHAEIEILFAILSFSYALSVGRTLFRGVFSLWRVPATPLHAEIYIFANHTNAFFLWARTFRAKAVKTKAV